MSFPDLKEEFPALCASRSEHNGEKIIFCDAPAGTQVHRSVVSAIESYYTYGNCNVGCPFPTGEITSATIATSRQAAADFLNCSISEVVFGPSMTSLAFQLSQTLESCINENDEIIVTRTDHDGNISPWLTLAERCKAVVRWVEYKQDDLTWDEEQFRSIVTARTKLIAVGYASNATGTVNNVKLAVSLARQVGALCLIDAVHASPHKLLDVRDLDCDFLFFSVYKVFGPHMAIMYGRQSVLETLQPGKVRPLPATLPSAECPYASKFERGTQNHEQMAAFTAVVKYLASVGQRFAPELCSMGSVRSQLVAAFSAIGNHERELARRFLVGIVQIPGVEVYGITELAKLDHRVATFSLRKAGVSTFDLCKFLGQNRVTSSYGHFYAYELCNCLNLTEKGGWLRVGFVHYHTIEDVDYVLDLIRQAN